MSDLDCELDAETMRLLRQRFKAQETSIQAIIQAYQDVSLILAEAQAKITALEARLTTLENHRAWTEHDTTLLDRIDDETRATICEALHRFRSDYGETLNHWRLDVLEEVRRERELGKVSLC